MSTPQRVSLVFAAVRTAPCDMNKPFALSRFDMLTMFMNIGQSVVFFDTRRQSCIYCFVLELPVLLISFSDQVKTERCSWAMCQTQIGF